MRCGNSEQRPELHNCAYGCLWSAIVAHICCPECVPRRELKMACAAQCWASVCNRCATGSISLCHTLSDRTWRCCADFACIAGVLLFLSVFLDVNPLAMRRFWKIPTEIACFSSGLGCSSVVWRLQVWESLAALCCGVFTCVRCSAFVPDFAYCFPDFT